MSKVRLYTFLDEDDNIIAEVRAENHDQAVSIAGSWSKHNINFSTDFYSEEIEDEEQQIIKV